MGFNIDVIDVKWKCWCVQLCSFSRAKWAKIEFALFVSKPKKATKRDSLYFSSRSCEVWEMCYFADHTYSQRHFLVIFILAWLLARFWIMFWIAVLSRMNFWALFSWYLHRWKQSLERRERWLSNEPFLSASPPSHTKKFTWQDENLCDIHAMRNNKEKSQISHEFRCCSLHFSECGEGNKAREGSSWCQRSPLSPRMLCCVNIQCHDRYLRLDNLQNINIYVHKYVLHHISCTCLIIYLICWYCHVTLFHLLQWKEQK
jgi:hypothetical protein